MYVSSSSSESYFSGHLFKKKSSVSEAISQTRPRTSEETTRSFDTAGSSQTKRSTRSSIASSGSKLLTRVTGLFESKETFDGSDPHIPDSPKLRALNELIESDELFLLKSTANSSNTRVPSLKAPVIVTDQFKMAATLPENCSYWTTDHGSNKKALKHLERQAKFLEKNGAKIQQQTEFGFRYAQSTLNSVERLIAQGSSEVLHQLHVTNPIGHQRAFQVAPREQGMNFASTDSLLLLPVSTRRSEPDWQNIQPMTKEIEVTLADKVCTASLRPISSGKEASGLLYVLLKRNRKSQSQIKKTEYEIMLDGEPFTFSHSRLKKPGFKTPIPRDLVVRIDGKLFIASRTPFVDPPKEKEVLMSLAPSRMLDALPLPTFKIPAVPKTLPEIKEQLTLLEVELDRQ
jgi:hypothetical protein